MLCYAQIIFSPLPHAPFNLSDIIFYFAGLSKEFVWIILLSFLVVAIIIISIIAIDLLRILYYINYIRNYLLRWILRLVFLPIVSNKNNIVRYTQCIYLFFHSIPWFYFLSSLFSVVSIKNPTTNGEEKFIK